MSDEALRFDREHIRYLGAYCRQATGNGLIHHGDAGWPEHSGESSPPAEWAVASPCDSVSVPVLFQPCGMGMAPVRSVFPSKVSATYSFVPSATSLSREEVV